MCRRALPAALLCLALRASAAVALDGRLHLEDGSAAAGYQVSIQGRPGAGTAMTARDGSFRFVPDPQLPFVLIVTGPSGDVFAPIDVRQAPAGVLDATLALVYAESVTVASGVAAAVEAPPGAATVTLAREDLERRRPQHVADALQGVAGASRSGEGPDAVPILRGLAGGRTLILLDGARVTAERRAGASAGFVDPFSLASVEVARGTGSVAYGSDAFGGVINLRTPDPEPGRWRGRYDAAAWDGGVDERGAGVAASGGVGRAGAFLLQAHARHSEDQEAAGGERLPNSSYRDRGGELRWALATGWGRWRAGLGLAEGRDIGKSAADVAVTRSFYPEESSRRLTLGLSIDPRGAWQGLEGSAFVGSYHLVTDRERQPQAGTQTRRLERSDVDADDAALRFEAVRAAASGRLLLGVESSARWTLEADNVRVDFDADDRPTRRTAEKAIESARLVDHAVFGSWERAAGRRLLVSAGLRGDTVESENQGGFFGDRAVTDQALSGSLALTFGPFADLTATMQGARGFRSPPLSDRFFRGTSGRGFIVGNPDLEAESSEQLDAALRWTRAGSALALHAYLYRIDDLIERFRPAGSDDFLFRNRGEAELEGVELEGQLALPLDLRVEVALAAARGEDRASGGALDSIAPRGGSLTLRWARGDASAFSRWSAFDADARPGPTEVDRPGHSTLEAGATYRVSERLEVRLLARNLLDRRYRESADANAALAPGRALSIGFAGRL